MKEFIPLFQSLVWPIFVGILIWIARRNVLGILEAIRQRIEAGDPFEAGPGGVKLGHSDKCDTAETAGMIGVKDKAKKKVQGEVEAKAETPEANLQKKIDEPENPGIYLAHKTRRDRSLDRGEYEYYRVRIFLETDPDVDIGCVLYVVYHLHPSFPAPERIVRDPTTQFEVRTAAWGQFNLTAEVYLKGHDKPVHLERYLNF